MFVSRLGSTLNAIFGMNEQGKSEATSRSDPQGITLSDTQKLAVKNSKFFEAGASMSLLEQPGKMGHVFDQHAKPLAGLSRHILDGQSEAANHTVHFQGRQSTRVSLQAQHPDLDLSTRVHDVEFHRSPEMIENRRLM